MIESKTVHTEAADIAYDIEGNGPLLLLVAGGNGDSQFLYAKLSAHLADRYTVVKYDRRADARSTGDVDGELDMAQAGRDAAAVIRAIDRGRAYVFGNSAGANIALKLTADHPQLVRGLIDHEPPITNFLPEPDASKWRAFFDKVYETYKTKGAGPAMGLWATSFVGFDTNVKSPGDQSTETQDRFLMHEFQHVNNYVPDVEALRRGGVPIVMVVGRASGDAFYVQTARELARQLPCPCVDIVGNHLSYRFDEAEQFANELDKIIQELSA